MGLSIKFLFHFCFSVIDENTISEYYQDLIYGFLLVFSYFFRPLAFFFSIRAHKHFISGGERMCDVCAFSKLLAKWSLDSVFVVDFFFV